MSAEIKCINGDHEWGNELINIYEDCPSCSLLNEPEFTCSLCSGSGKRVVGASVVCNKCKMRKINHNMWFD